MFKKAVQRGRSERRDEAYFVLYVESLSDARTKLEDFFNILQELLDRVRRSRQHGPVAFLHDRPLNKVGVFHHQVEQLIVGELFLRQTELAVQIFFGSKHVIGGEAGFLQKRCKLCFGKRPLVVVDGGKRRPAVLEQLDGLSACRASRFVIDRDIGHSDSLVKDAS